MTNEPEMAPETPGFDRREAGRAFGLAALAMALMETAAQGLSFLLVFLVCPVLPEWLLQSVLFQWVLGVLPLYLVGMPLARWVLRRLPARCPEPRSLPLWQGLMSFLSGYGMMFAGSLLGLGVTRLIRLLSGSGGGDSPLPALTSAAPWWYNLLAVAVVAPLLEELVFRRWLLDRLRPYGEGAAMLFSTVVFGMIHGNFQQFLSATGMGLVAGWLYLRTGRLRDSVLLHAAVNLMGGVIAPAVFTSGNGLLQLQFAGLVFALAVAGLVLLIPFGRRAVRALPPPADGASRSRQFQSVFLTPGFGVFAAVMTAVYVLGFLL